MINQSILIICQEPEEDKGDFEGVIYGLRCVIEKKFKVSDAKITEMTKNQEVIKSEVIEIKSEMIKN